MSGDCTFALDVGTRSVVGIVMERVEDGFKVKAAEMEEHQERAMLDGQIHDIPMVASVVARIKAKLEKKTGRTLQEVAVAAAGRTLQTAKGRAIRDTSWLADIDHHLVANMQLEAVQEAQRSLNDPTGEYHCVGFTVLNSWLDHSRIGNLVGQRGNRVEIEVIATFLPRVVINSLQAVLQRAGLEMAHLTLEPIAALNVAIPSNMRQLNLGLVDVGAGTSDIAITASGSVVGYAMVPSAGDEITEEICQHLLVDFATAEDIKRRLNQQMIEFTDVVGFSHCIAAEEIIAVVAPQVDEIAKLVANKMIEINGKAPQAVICIGGGSLTPGFTKALATNLGLPASRVAVRGREVITMVTGGPKFLEGPQCVTPIGIGVTAFLQQSLSYIPVTVNERPVRILQNQKSTVADAILSAGIPLRKLYGKPGAALAVEINGRLTFIKGQMGTPAQIRVNGREVTLEEEVSANDIVTITPAQDGAAAHGFVADVIPSLNAKTIYINKQPHRVEPQVFMNGEPVSGNTPLIDNCKIQYHPMATVGDVLSLLGFRLELGQEIKLNNERADLDTIINDGDHLTFDQPSLLPKGIIVECNGRPLAITGSGSPVIIADLFPLIDLDPTQVRGGKRLLLELNGEPATFTTVLKEGCKVTVQWIDN